MTAKRVPEEGRPKECEVCATPFLSRRDDARICGAVCRKQAKRWRDGAAPVVAPELDPTFATPHHAPIRDGDGWRDPGGALWQWAGDVLRSEDGRERRLWRAVGEIERDRVARFLLLRRA